MSETPETDQFYWRRIGISPVGRSSAEWAEFARNLETERNQLRIALEKSVRLQSHYSKLLNIHDGGNRLQFQDAKSWLERLTAIGDLE